jgi:hypothetical protein
VSLGQLQQQLYYDSYDIQSFIENKDKKQQQFLLTGNRNNTDNAISSFQQALSNNRNKPTLAIYDSTRGCEQRYCH